MSARTFRIVWVAILAVTALWSAPWKTSAISLWTTAMSSARYFHEPIPQ